ncbi:MAG: hypothetical protein J6U04_08635 [Salinivirgaceae bacterium]|nr:hypothetical protein [Salinivirgaceae bacterium]
MMLFIDKHIVARIPKVLLVLIGIISVLLSLFYRPYTQKELYVEGVISEYVEEIISGSFGKGGGSYHHEFYYIIIDGIRISISAFEREKFEGKKWYWKEKLEGKYAKVYYCERDNQFTSIELEDGSYSYHDPHEISYYDVGWFPFCITAPIALFCIFVILRFFYLLIFATDERRELVFGDKDYNPF